MTLIFKHCEGENQSYFNHTWEQESKHTLTGLMRFMVDKYLDIMNVATLLGH